MLTDCAVRGIETQAGRVAGVVTEKGRIACDAVVLAGGAWSRLFCGNLGIDLPQLKVLDSVMRTEPLDGGPESRAGGSAFALPQAAGRRLHDRPWRTVDVADIVPDSFPLLPRLPAGAAAAIGELRLRVGRRFLEEWRTARAAGRSMQARRSRRCACSIRSPSRRSLEAALAQHVKQRFPAFARCAGGGELGRLIDVTPDAVPVISPVDSCRASSSPPAFPAMASASARAPAG